MTAFDVFNGDADGLCSLHQLRLVTPCDSVLVSGPKREIALLERLDAAPGDVVTVLDVSLAANRAALERLLERGVAISYFDHHHAGDIPRHPRLRATIDGAPDVCTAMLVDVALDGAHRVWAVVAAFGDNLDAAAIRLAAPLALAPPALARLRDLGETLNYNGYGDEASDLIVQPDALYRALSRYVDPLAFIDEAPIYRRLTLSRQEDLERSETLAPTAVYAGATVHVLADAAWSRRVRGVFANRLANRLPRLAHAVLTPNRRGNYTVSLRTPAAGADRFCLAFPTGGGRAIAAGINDLPREDLAEFLRRLDGAFPTPV